MKLLEGQQGSSVVAVLPLQKGGKPRCGWWQYSLYRHDRFLIYQSVLVLNSSLHQLDFQAPRRVREPQKRLGSYCHPPALSHLQGWGGPVDSPRRQIQLVHVVTHRRHRNQSPHNDYRTPFQFRKADVDWT